MNTLVLTVHLVNRAATWSTADTEVLLDLLAGIHSLIGGLIVVTAVLLVATAGPRWRTRITTAIVALLMIGIVVAGCAPAASAATPAATPGEGPDFLLIATGVAILVVVGSLFLTALRVAFHVLTIVARALEVAFIARHAVLFGGGLALVLVVMASRT